MNADGSAKQLTRTAAHEEYPAWSPDGAHIAFESNRNGFTDVFVMNADGSEAHALTNDGGADRFPEWSPTGDRISFASDRDRGYDVWVMRADGANQRQVTYVDPGAMDKFPTWSPDGRRIAFEREAISRRGTSELYVVASAGGALRRLTDEYVAFRCRDWSPDGTRLAFSAVQRKNRDVDVMNAERHRATAPDERPADDEGPTWSPSGERIAFTSRRDGTAQIYVMGADGSNQRRLT